MFDSGDLGPPDGFGVIQGNNRFSGDPIFNNNDGTVALIDPVATPRSSSPVAARAAIASGATPPATALVPEPEPEPESYALFAAGLAAVAFVRRPRPMPLPGSPPAPTAP